MDFRQEVKKLHESILMGAGYMRALSDLQELLNESESRAISVKDLSKYLRDLSSKKQMERTMDLGGLNFAKRLVGEEPAMAEEESSFPPKPRAKKRRKAPEPVEEMEDLPEEEPEEEPEGEPYIVDEEEIEMPVRQRPQATRPKRSGQVNFGLSAAATGANPSTSESPLSKDEAEWFK